MLCRTCQEIGLVERRAEQPDETDELCSRCGDLRAPESLVKRARDKLAQLARFGLAGTRRVLLDRRRRVDD